MEHVKGILGMDFVPQYGCQIIATPGGELELFIWELTSASGSEARQAEETAQQLSMLKGGSGDKVLVPVTCEMITARNVPDKCHEGLAVLEPTLDVFSKQTCGGQITCQNRLSDSYSGLKKHSGSAFRTSRWRTVVKALKELRNRLMDGLSDEQIRVLLTYSLNIKMCLILLQSLSAAPA